ncbi:2-succinyl-6-hydroxy-2,4-cyclohexadiene-1-carboxylate synthase [Shewanella sp.]|uniref:2-succinyl-6-hydroxy-2, 4-cyclohexadiene-1-carboxylate synthase n=1 Tax=Shewanella sp. TaxID=50422 RepID=UPI003D0C2A01
MLAYRTMGKAELPALVLLHGFLGSKTDWQLLMPRLSRHFHCIALDLPGHGDSPALAETSQTTGFDLVVEQILATLDKLEVKRFHLLGYSLGGRIALHLAASAPARLLSINLESCHPGLDSEQARTERLKQDSQWQTRLLSLPLVEFLDLWYRQGVFATLNDSERQALIQARATNNPKALASIYLPTSLGNQADLSRIPKQIAIDWHYYAGKQDNKFLTLAQSWQSHQPISLTLFDQAGHNVHLAQPEAFCDSLIAKLRTHS